MKVVINACYGGFGLSDRAYERLIERGWTVTTYTEEGNLVDASADIVEHKASKFLMERDYDLGKWYSNEPALRMHPDLVAVVEALGDEANTRISKLKIVEIPDDAGWTIASYCGQEWVAECHRSWD